MSLVKNLFLVMSAAFLSSGLCAMDQSNSSSYLLSNYDFGAQQYQHYGRALRTLDQINNQLKTIVFFIGSDVPTQNQLPRASDILNNSTEHHSFIKILQPDVLGHLSQLLEEFDSIAFIYRSGATKEEAIRVITDKQAQIECFLNECKKAIDEAGANYINKIIAHKAVAPLTPNPVLKDHSANAVKNSLPKPQNISESKEINEDSTIKQVIQKMLTWMQDRPVKTTLGLILGAFGLYSLYKWVSK